MALTTAANRNSGLHANDISETPIFPDNVIAQADRQSSLNSYGGISAATLTAGTASSVMSNIWFFFIEDEHE